MGDFSSYIHLPFCRGRCPYCDFASSDVLVVPVEPYRRIVELEWLARAVSFSGWTCRSRYIGGGTPSLWPASELGALIGLPVDRAALAIEITVEANPGDADPRWYEQLVGDHGVNRFSIGVQALDDSRLRWLGRRHDEAAAVRAVNVASGSGARSVSADLIFGTPKQRSESLEAELRKLCDLGIDHLSAYELTVAAGTPLAGSVAAGDTQLPGEERLTDLWYTVGATAAEYGLERYEVSSYARPGHQCVHNEAYWSGGYYVGLGAGAHGFLPGQEAPSSSRAVGVRYANGDDVGSYSRAVDSGGETHPRGGFGDGQLTETIDAVTFARERIMLGLRTSAGAPIESILAEVPPEIAARWRKLLDALVAEKMAMQGGGRLVPTARGMLFADGLAERFF